MRRLIGGLLLGLAVVSPARAQSAGAIAGVIREAGPEQRVISGARISVDGGRYVAASDEKGQYRVRDVPVGWHIVTTAAISHRPVSHDSVLVQAGQTTALDFSLQSDPVGLEPIEVIAQRVESVLDPLAIQDQQRFTQEDLRRLPVSSVEEAIGLSAGAVGESYRGGRLGEQAFIIDGLGLKNQLDASTGNLGVRVPPEMLSEASLVTNGFSARYGQAVSALVNLVTRDGADRWTGRVAYETDRPMGQGADHGLDRTILTGEGPLPHGIRVLAVADVSGRLDADPVNAPAPADLRDPRHNEPWILPHNSGEQADLALKLTVPMGQRQTLRLLGLRSAAQRLLYDPAYKYDQTLAPVSRTTGNLLNAHVQRTFPGPNINADLRLGYFSRDFIRGDAVSLPGYQFGAFTGKKIDIMGEQIARDQDTALAASALPGFVTPDWSVNTPWGVPAFFLGRGPRGDLGWNHFREYRGRLDLSLPAGATSDLYFGGEYSRQRVNTFQRVLGYLPVGDTVPAASAATFTPWAGALYAEVQARSNDLALTVGMRYDQFSGRNDLPGKAAKTQRGLSPRLAVSTVFRGATFVASFGKFRQAPDYQYLVNAAFDDTTRTGRFRQGNPDLGYEESTQYEFSLRVRATRLTSVRANLYVRRLDGLVASVPFGVNPDSSIFGNADAGSVKGLELVLERQFSGVWGARVSYNLQDATATSTNAFFIRRLATVDPVTGDTTFPAKVEFPLDFDRRHSLTAIVTATSPPGVGPRVLGMRPLSGWEGTAILRWATGLPYSRTNAAGDSIIGVPNDQRLPATTTVDLLVRRPLHFGGIEGSLYLDVRNLLNRRNIVSVRRDTGTLSLDPAGLQAMADAAYQANPDPIPYESPRYRRFADKDNNGYVEGQAELMPLYLAAARDYTQPLFAYGPPRLFRLGMEVIF
ncbi:MAG TPA: TonB-dependent receptor [Gemmatimonadales bacterium]|nr:TonB-dependent receptor [Gemmatimonadales bacterium]